MTGSIAALRFISRLMAVALRLEEILERRVFDRNSRSPSLRRDGEHLLAAARRMLEFNDALMRDLREPQAVGILRLGISEDFVPRNCRSCSRASAGSIRKSIST
jgi:hypothetical protein